MEGGFFAGEIQVSGTSYNLIVAPKATGENSSVAYKTSPTADSPSATAQNIEYGKLATDAFNDAAHPAFQWAKGLSIGGFTDWYIPAQNELAILYLNLNPSKAVTGFQTGGSEAFASAFYWSSSETPTNTGGAIIQNPVTGTQGDAGSKTLSLYARAIRRVAA
jgi:hypothetical protein